MDPSVYHDLRSVIAPTTKKYVFVPTYAIYIHMCSTYSKLCVIWICGGLHM